MFKKWFNFNKNNEETQNNETEETLNNENVEEVIEEELPIEETPIEDIEVSNDIENIEEDADEILVSVVGEELPIEDMPIEDIDIIEENEENTINIELDDEILPEKNDEENQEEKSKGMFARLKSGLSKARQDMTYRIDEIFNTYTKVDEELLEELEEVLIMADVGVETSLKIIDSLRTRIKKEKIENEEDVRNVLREEMQNILKEVDNSLNLNTKLSVILIVGVNGVRKNYINRKNSK